MVLVIGALSGGTLAAMIFIPDFVENVLGIPAEKSVYWMTPLALASGVGAGMGEALVAKRGPVFAVLLSGIVAAAGFALYSRFGLKRSGNLLLQVFVPVSAWGSSWARL